jgi:predicted metal-binding protein
MKDSNPRASGEVLVFVCGTCRGDSEGEIRPRPGQLFGDRVTALNRFDNIRVERTACLANCRRPLSATFVRPGAWTYIFGDLVLADANDLLEGARLLRDSPDGSLPGHEMPECLKRGLVSSIPPRISK